jgi:hypothetical protein
MGKSVKTAARPKVVCPRCDGAGCMWSERSLAKWEAETPWFDRESMSPKPPESWRDLNCERCQSAGYLDAETQEPALDRLIDSGQRRARRRRMEGQSEGRP